MNTILRTMTALAASSALCGCAAMDSLHWSYPGPGNSRVITVDAKQRHLILNKVVTKVGGNVTNEQIRACAEPAPDTMAAYSSSLAGFLGLAPREAQFSSAAGETVASLERTQTVNLLREMLYRTCERWLSGALDQKQFLALSARDHRSLVAVLAVEQLTGVVKPPSTIISGPAVAASIGQSKELLKILAVYQEERGAAEKAETKAMDDYNKVNEEITVNGAKVRVCTLAKREDAGEAAAKFDNCKPADDAKKATKGSADAARAREQSVLDQLAGLAGGIGSAVRPGQIQLGGRDDGDDDKLTQLDLAKLAETVRDIVITPGIDEALMFCIGYLAEDKNKLDQTVTSTCTGILARRAANDEQFLNRFSGYRIPGAVYAERGPGIDRYTAFRNRFAELVKDTPPKEWTSYWNPFTTTTNGNLNICGQQASCASYLSDDSNKPFLQSYPTRSDDFDAALDAWALRLSNKGGGT